MEKEKNIFTLFNKVSALWMMLALLWLTISAPFVFSAQHDKSTASQSEQHSVPSPDAEEESSNPYSSTTEEKAPASTSLSEEFLHDGHTYSNFFAEMLQHFANGDAGTYIAFHGELLVPPPNQA